MASICNHFEPDIRPDVKEKINTVRIENKGGKCFAVATNEKIAAVEYLHNTDQPDGYVHIILDPALLKQCEIEMTLDSDIYITAVEQIAVATAKTTLGYTQAGNCCYWFDDSPLNDWSSWFPEDVATESQGAMCWNSFHVEVLVKSSPSGEISFPEFINVNNPVILRDTKSPNWVGLFIPVSYDTIKPAVKPDWI
tara:strand:+ start:692 stop:1276 length:585 start_codon:yes stop_codon:yes gene_type:complete